MPRRRLLPRRAGLGVGTVGMRREVSRSTVAGRGGSGQVAASTSPLGDESGVADSTGCSGRGAGPLEDASVAGANLVRRHECGPPRTC